MVLSNPHNNVDIRAGQLVEFELSLNVNCNYITHMLSEAFPDDEQLLHDIRVMEHLPNQPLEMFWDEFNSELPCYQGFMYDMEEGIIKFANGNTEGEIKKVFDCAFDSIIKDLYKDELQSANAIIYEEDKEEEEPIICEDCDRDFTEECDDRSSFEEIGKVQCMDCHNHPECDDCGEKMMLDSSEPYCDGGCGDEEPPVVSDWTVQEVFRQLMDEGKLESRVNEDTGMVEYKLKSDFIKTLEEPEDEIVEEFMLNENDRDERLKAHYRQGKVIDGKWVNDNEE